MACFDSRTFCRQRYRLEVNDARIARSISWTEKFCHLRSIAKSITYLHSRQIHRIDKRVPLTKFKGPMQTNGTIIILNIIRNFLILCLTLIKP